MMNYHTKNKMHTRAAALCALAFLVCAALPGALLTQQGEARAQTGSQDEPSDVNVQVEKLSEEGVNLFHQNRYKEAIERFKKAYSLSPVANLLFNIATCYEKLDDPKSALENYELLVNSDSNDAEAKSAALTKIRELEKLLREREAANNPDKPGEKDDKGNGDKANNGPDNPNPTTGNTGGSNQGNQNTTTQRDSGTLTTVGIITAVGGVVLAGTGGVFGILAQSNQDNFEEVRTLEEKNNARDEGEQNALTADILYVGGGIAIVTGLLLVLFDPGEEVSDDPNKTSWHLTPFIGDDQAGLNMRLTWE